MGVIGVFGGYTIHTLTGVRIVFAWVGGKKGGGREGGLRRFCSLDATMCKISRVSSRVGGVER